MLPLLIHIPLILFVLHRIGKWRQAKPVLFWSAFLVRLLCAWCVGLVYTYYYSANDTWLLFQEATKLTALARNEFGDFLLLLWKDDLALLEQAGLSIVQDRSLLFIRVISVINLFAFDSYWVVAAYFSVISFLAAWYFFEKLCSLEKQNQTAGILALLFFPSVVFWSSGIIKETLALAGIFLLSGSLISFVLHKRLRWQEWLMLLPALYLAWGLKYYWTAIFVVSAVSIFIYFLAERSFHWVAKARIPVWLSIFVLLLVAASFVHPNFYLESFLEVVVSNHDLFVMVSQSDDVIHFYTLTATWWSMVQNAPLALFSALFRPWVGEASGLMSVLASLENLLLIVLTLFALRYGLLLLTAPRRVLLWSVLVYVVLLAVFLALSTPNFGTLSRYRVGFLPFFIYLLLLANPAFMGRIDRWTKSFRR